MTMSNEVVEESSFIIVSVSAPLVVALPVHVKKNIYIKQTEDSTPLFHQLLLFISQQDQVIRRCNTCLATFLTCLPPSTRDIRDFQNIVLLERDFVGVFGVGSVRINSLGAVWIFGRLVRLIFLLWSHASAGTARSSWWSTELGRLRRSVGDASTHRQWRGSFQAAELGGSVHLGDDVIANSRLRSSRIVVRSRMGAIFAWRRSLGERVDVVMGNSIRSSSEVKDPEN